MDGEVTAKQGASPKLVGACVPSASGFEWVENPETWGGGGVRWLSALE